MDLQIIDVEQGSPEWYAARAGIPTASQFATVMAKGKTKGSPSITRRKYLCQLVGERLTGVPMESYSNSHMERGKEMEAEARELYELVTGRAPVQVGFLRRGDMGCSPDSLIDDDGLLEIKTALPHIQIERLLENRLPPEHVAQCQGQLLISQRKWLDFVSYWPGLPILIVRVYPDREVRERIEYEVKAFLAEMDQVIDQVKAYKVAA